MRPICWLHVSDIHLRPRDAWSQDVVLKAMCVDIARQRGERAADFILVSGDIAFSGKAEEYSLASEFLDALSVASGVPKVRIFCIPGNHDIDRDRHKLSFIGARTYLEDQNRTDALLATASLEDLATLLKREEGYRAFQSAYFADQERVATEDGLGYVSRLTIDGIHLAIVGLDSAWLAEGGINDHGRLLLGERQVINAVRLAQEGDDPPHIILAMSHHPLHLLNEFDRRPVQNRVERDCHFLHCGHLHDPEVRPGRQNGMGCLTLAAGASFDTRQFANAYSIVTLDLLQAKTIVKTIRYNPGDGAFSSESSQHYPIEVHVSATPGVTELATSIAIYAPLFTWSHYLAALLLDQKAEIVVPTPTGHTFASFAVMEGQPDGDFKRTTAAFRAFRNALRVLYDRVPLAEILRQHGDAVARYGTGLSALAAGQPQLKARLDEQEADARLLAAVEPHEAFSHTAALLTELASACEWDLLREQAERHLDSAAPAVAEKARRMLALALANSTEPTAKAAAIAHYQLLTGAASSEPTDWQNLAMLLLDDGRLADAKAVVLEGIGKCSVSAAGHFAEVGHRIVEATGDRDFRRQLAAAVAERGNRE